MFSVGFVLFCLMALHHNKDASIFKVCLSKNKFGSIPPNSIPEWTLISRLKVNGEDDG